MTSRQARPTNERTGALESTCLRLPSPWQLFRISRGCADSRATGERIRRHLPVDPAAAGSNGSVQSPRTAETHRRFHGGAARDRVRGRAACVPDSRPLRSRGTTPLLALLTVLCLPSAALAQFTITRVSSPTFYEDAGLTGMYAGYE